MQAVDLYTYENKESTRYSIERRQTMKGYTVVIKRNRRLQKSWSFANPVIDNVSISQYWFDYLTKEMRQNIALGIAGVPEHLKQLSSSNVQGMVQSLLVRS